VKALAKLEPGPGIAMIDAPEPAPGPNDLLIRITHTSICGTDVHIHAWDDWAARTIPVPMITGHEYVGVVEAVGGEVEGYAVGDRVSGEGHITCGHCRNCRAGRRHLCRETKGVGVDRPGAFAERFVLPAFNAFKVPDGIPDEWAAILDPFGNAVHTALAFDLVGEDVLITGAGPIGVMASAIARFGDGDTAGVVSPRVAPRLAHGHVRITLPARPAIIASKPFSKSSTGKRCVITGARSRPAWSRLAILYQVSNISRP
jgi:threonine 3-dehydrogenase